MPVSNVSFGRVVVAVGKDRNIDRLHRKMTPQLRHGTAVVRDVTEKYYYIGQPGMLLADAARSGKKIEVYITDKDVEKFKKQEPGWDTIEGVLTKMAEIVKVDDMSLSEAFDKII